MSAFDDRYAAAALDLLSKSPSQESLKAVLRLLARYRTKLLQNTLVQTYGINVQAGPFEGMIFSDQSTEGCFIPKLLGCYEAELHPFIENMRLAPYDTIINIGSAEGYYATGFKRMNPETRVIARDTDVLAQISSQKLAEKNGVSLEVGGAVTWSSFDELIQGRTLVWCDIEGVERSLLDPEKAPRLLEVDLVVECHGVGVEQRLPLMISRFQASHDLEVLKQQGHVPKLPPLLDEFDHLDQLLAQWEFRTTPTPWVIARVKRQPH